jgi:hypothetical protein
VSGENQLDPKRPHIERPTKDTGISKCSPYALDWYDTYLIQERCASALFRPLFNGVQTEVNEYMRAVLVDWMIEVVGEFHLPPEVFSMAVLYVDRILNCVSLVKASLQLLGITCLFIAAKLEGYDGMLSKFVSVTDGAYTREQVLEMEGVIYDKLKFQLLVVTVDSFLPLFLEVAGLGVYNGAYLYSRFLNESIMTDYEMRWKYCPSVIAAGITSMCMQAFRSSTWSDTLSLFTMYSEQELQGCISDIRNCVRASKFKAAQDHYEIDLSKSKSIFDNPQVHQVVDCAYI